MSDDQELLSKLHAELASDKNVPVLDTAFDPFDVVAVEMMIIEADRMMDRHARPFLERYRPQFENPALLDDYMTTHKEKVRQSIRSMVASAQEEIRRMGYSPEDYVESDGEEKPLN